MKNYVKNPWYKWGKLKNDIIILTWDHNICSDCWYKRLKILQQDFT